MFPMFRLEITTSLSHLLPCPEFVPITDFIKANNVQIARNLGCARSIWGGKSARGIRISRASSRFYHTQRGVSGGGSGSSVCESGYPGSRLARVG